MVSSMYMYIKTSKNIIYFCLILDKEDLTTRYTFNTQTGMDKLIFRKVSLRHILTPPPFPGPKT